MRQHPIPQNILDIEFKLFTKFTIKEFAYIAGGIVFGGIFLYFYTKGQLPGLIAFPIFIASSAAGIILGVVPINGQKADTFLKNYIAAITSPTQRAWKNAKFEGKIKPGGDITRGSMNRTDKISGQIVGASRDSLKQQKYVETNDMETEEASRLAAITASAQAIEGTTPTPQPVTLQTTKVKEVPNRLDISIHNSEKYDAKFNAKLPGNVNLILNDKASTPVSNAIITLKDLTGKVLYVNRSNSVGQSFTQKTIPIGTYMLDIKADSMKFPDIQLTIEDKQLPVIKIVEI